MKAPSTSPRRRTRWIMIPVKILLAFVALLLLMVVIYRFVPPPVTLTMLFDPNGITKDWTSLDEIDPDGDRRGGWQILQPSWLRCGCHHQGGAA